MLRSHNQWKQRQVDCGIIMLICGCLDAAMQYDSVIDAKRGKYAEEERESATCSFPGALLSYHCCVACVINASTVLYAKSLQSLIIKCLRERMLSLYGWITYPSEIHTGWGPSGTIDLTACCNKTHIHLDSMRVGLGKCGQASGAVNTIRARRKVKFTMIFRG